MSEENVSQVLSDVLMKRCQGELLTVADAVSGDKVQRDAIKSLIRRSCHDCYAELLSRLGPNGATTEAGKAAG